MKKILFVILFGLFLLLTGCGQKEMGQEYSLTLTEAIKLASSDILKQHTHARLIDATSVDNKEGIATVDGKSRGWDITFGIPGTNAAFLVNVYDGKITGHADISDESATPLSQEHFITDFSEIKFDSPELLKKAMQTAKLYPSSNWKEEYTFVISKNTEKDMILIKIIGWDENEDKIKKLQFDASTGELHKSVEEGS